MQTVQRHLDRSTYTKGNRELEITEKQTKIRKRQGRWVIARSDAKGHYHDVCKDF